MGDLVTLPTPTPSPAATPNDEREDRIAEVTILLLSASDDVIAAVLEDVRIAVMRPTGSRSRD